MLGLKAIGAVLEEDQAKDDVLVVGRVLVVAPRIDRLTKLLLKSESGPVYQFGIRLFLACNNMGGLHSTGNSPRNHNYAFDFGKIPFRSNS